MENVDEGEKLVTQKVARDFTFIYQCIYISLFRKKKQYYRKSMNR